MIKNPERCLDFPTAYIHEIDRLPRLKKAVGADLFISEIFNQSKDNLNESQSLPQDQIKALNMAKRFMRFSIFSLLEEIKAGNNPLEQQEAKIIRRKIALYESKGIISTDLLPDKEGRNEVKNLVINFQAMDYEKYMGEAA